jgi:hypothetical protein
MLPSAFVRACRFHSASVTYDANGDVTNDSIHTYTWDGFGNATTIDGISALHLASQFNLLRNKAPIVTTREISKRYVWCSRSELDFALFPQCGWKLSVISTVPRGLRQSGVSGHAVISASIKR